MLVGAGRARRIRLAPLIFLPVLATSFVPSLIGAAWAGPQPTLAECRRPDAPPPFHRQVRLAIRLSGNLPRTWAASPYLAKIVCWQGTGFSTGFQAYGPRQKWIGVFAMTKREMQTIAGPWLSNDRNELILHPDCFIHGWDACPHRTKNTRVVQQLVAGMRWIWLNYGRPHVAWRHIVKTGRFNSY